eukprot:TRINITY_DN1068_c2_g2_i3.p1 TRINITY_DN1068_c2_g2~~TRINITY_DN1068_c2_g2_i3.p1  ORF type:complete len:1226 (-),score=365.89 TRINITY_DN1068_c2_g2_i3:74-3751(-)
MDARDDTVGPKKQIWKPKQNNTNNSECTPTLTTAVPAADSNLNPEQPKPKRKRNRNKNKDKGKDSKDSESEPTSNANNKVDENLVDIPKNSYNKKKTNNEETRLMESLNQADRNGQNSNNRKRDQQNNRNVRQNAPQQERETKEDNDYDGNNRNYRGDRNIRNEINERNYRYDRNNQYERGGRTYGENRNNRNDRNERSYGNNNNNRNDRNDRNYGNERNNNRNYNDSNYNDKNYNNRNNRNNRNDRNDRNDRTNGNERNKRQRERKRRQFYPDYYPLEQVEKGLKEGKYIETELRVNPFNRTEGYASVEGQEIDVFIERKNQNRAFDGDTIIIEYLPEDQWVPFKKSKFDDIEAPLEGNEVSVAVNEEDVDVDEDIEELEESSSESEDAAGDVIVMDIPNSEVKTPDEIKNVQPTTSDQVTSNTTTATTPTDGSTTKKETTEPNNNNKQPSNNNNNNNQKMRPTARVIYIKEARHRTRQFVGFLELSEPSKKSEKNNNNNNNNNNNPTTTEGQQTTTDGKKKRRRGKKNKESDENNTSTTTTTSPTPTPIPSSSTTTSSSSTTGSSVESDVNKLSQMVSKMNITENNTSSSPPPPAKRQVRFIPIDRKAPVFIIRGNDHRIPDDFIHHPDKYSRTYFSIEFENWFPDLKLPFGKISRMVGIAGNIPDETEAILDENGFKGIRVDFHPNLISGIPNKVDINQKELQLRTDLRKERIFTIDPLTAKDLDDALSCKPLQNGNFEVGVHIADVSHYIPPGSILDVEAERRSTSVYLVQKCIPMLPPILCENLCSLNPREDRFAFSIVWEMTPECEIVNQKIFKSIIRSCVKLSYEDAQKVIENKEEGIENIKTTKNPELPSEDIAMDILNLYKLSKVMRQKRFDDGALSLGKSRLYFTLDEDQNPTGFKVYQYRDSNKLVEEFMLLANTCIAQFIHKKFPEQALLRRHAPPNAQKQKEFLKLCHKLGITIDWSSSGAFFDSLESLVSRYPNIPYIRQIMEDFATRPMMQAKYFCTGDAKDVASCRHYALSLPFYTHFTSPIRRYPDVIVHRLAYAAITGNDGGVAQKHKVSLIAKHSNTKKTDAKKAGSQSELLYLCVYLKDKQFCDENCVVADLDKESIYIYSPALGLSCKVQVGSKCTYNDKEQIATIKWKDEKSSKKKKKDKTKVEESNNTESDQTSTNTTTTTEDTESSPFPPLVLKPFSTVKIHFQVNSESRRSEVKAVLLPQ